MSQEEKRDITKKEDELTEVLKPGVLRDDLFEDIVHREYISRREISEDFTLRVTPIYEEKTGMAKLISTGKGKAQDAMDKVIRAERIEHERVTPKAYPGEVDFEPEKVKRIAGPRFARTLKVIREGLGVPKLPLLGAVEDVAAVAEKDFEGALNRFLGVEQAKSSEEASKGEKLKELNKATEGFKPKFEKEGGEVHALDG